MWVNFAPKNVVCTVCDEILYTVIDTVDSANNVHIGAT